LPPEKRPLTGFWTQLSYAEDKTAGFLMGKYAADSAQNFVAEVFVGLVSGKTYSQRIMQLYFAYGGVHK
jgi:hypothetical protein